MVIDMRGIREAATKAQCRPLLCALLLLVLFVAPAAASGRGQRCPFTLDLGGDDGAGCRPKDQFDARTQEILRVVYQSPSLQNAAASELTGQGVHNAQTQNWGEAVPHLRAAFFLQPYREDAALNLAVVLREYAMSLPLKEKEQQWRLLCEALAAAELSTYIQPTKADGPAHEIKAIKGELDENFRGRCHSVGSCDRYKDMQVVMVILIMA